MGEHMNIVHTGAVHGELPRNSVASHTAMALDSAAISMTNNSRGPGAFDPVRHADGRPRVTASRSLRSRGWSLQRGGSAVDASIVAGGDDAAAAVLDADRRYRRRLTSAAAGCRWSPIRCPAQRWPPCPLVAWVFGADVINVAVLAVLAALAAAFDPAGMTARAVDAARGRRPRGLVAGPHQQHLRGGLQPGLHGRARASAV